MANVLLKVCTACHEYTLQDVCPRCGAAAKPNRPAKFSPEDHYGEYRRRLKRLEAGERPRAGQSASAAATPAPAAQAGKPATDQAR